MSKPKQPPKVKLIASIFSPEEVYITKAIQDLSDLLGLIDWISELIPFNRTKYYEREMGWPIVRRFVSFEALVDPVEITDIKLKTNQLENKYSVDNKRLVNIDPGYIALERLVLATGKNYTHRIYLRDGIYADLTLIFYKGSFSPLSWTYPDYKEDRLIQWFNKVREKYKDQLRGIMCQKA